MEIQYAVAIAAGGLFGLLFLIAFCTYMYNKSKQRELLKKISDMYNDSNLARIDYDLGVDDESSRMVSSSRTDGQLTIEDVLFDGTGSPVDEGMEEITGNYKPD